MPRKTLHLVFLIGAYFAAGFQSSAPPASIFSMEIPEFGLRAKGDGSLVVPHPNFTHFEIHIQKTGFDYGSIRSKINTESANIVMSTLSKGAEVVCSFDLNLRSGFQFGPGRNSVEISFVDRRGKIYYSSFLLRGSSPAQFQARPRAPRIEPPADKYAVIIGVSQYAYRDRGLENLAYASRDAGLFRDFLVSPEGGGFKKENIVYLIDGEATSANIRTAFYNFLTRPREQDMAVIYFAGHGAPDPNDPRQLYLLTHDTDPTNMGGTAFLMADFQDVFVRILKPKRIVTFADACHSRGLSGMLYGGAEQKNNLINQYLTRFAGESERAIITASDISESSMESDSWGGGHDVFTYFLVEGLKGKADLNGDGTVVAGELFQYVQQQVQKATARQQNPAAVAGLSENLPLSGVGLRKAVRSLGVLRGLGGLMFANYPEIHGSFQIK